MSLGEAIISSIIIFITAIIVASAAQTVSVTNDVKVPEVEIVWQQRLVHNAINNPYIILSEEETETDPDRELVEHAGFVPYTEGVKTDSVPAEEYTAVPTEIEEEQPDIPEEIEKEQPESPVEDSFTIEVEEEETIEDFFVDTEEPLAE